MKIISIQDCDIDDINFFDCGNLELNKYFKEYAFNNDKNNIGKTFIMKERHKIIGFYTLSSAQLEYRNLSHKLRKSLPRYPIPCIRIARLAIDKNYQRKGYGKILIKDALIRILSISRETGVYFVLVDAKKEAKGFYERLSFEAMPNQQSTYIISIQTIIKAFNKKH